MLSLVNPRVSAFLKAKGWMRPAEEASELFLFTY
jgi:hypothetical protein